MRTSAIQSQFISIGSPCNFQMKKTKLLIIQFVLLAVVGIFAVLYYKRETEPVTVYRYTRTIEYDEDNDYQLQPEDVTAVQIPRTTVTKNFVTSLSQLEGEITTDEDGSQIKTGAYLKNTVYAGEYAMMDHITTDGELRDPIKELGKDYRLITLPTSMQTSLAGELNTGDTIDLLYVGKGSTTNETTGEAYSFTYTKLFMQNVLIYKMYTSDGSEYKSQDMMNQEASQRMTLGSDTTASGESEQTAGTPAYMTLAVSVSQAEEIYARLQTGTIFYVGQLAQSEEVQPLGYVVGEYSKIFLGQGNAETNGLYVDSDIENAVVANLDDEAKESSK